MNYILQQGTKEKIISSIRIKYDGNMQVLYIGNPAAVKDLRAPQSHIPLTDDDYNDYKVFTYHSKQ